MSEERRHLWFSWSCFSFVTSSIPKTLVLIINILLNNDYPLDFIFTTIRNRIKTLIHNSVSSQSTSLSSPSSSPPSPSFFTIPYVRGITERWLPIIKNLNTSAAYACFNKLIKTIKTHKNPLPSANHCNVYKIHCRDCDASYMDQTNR